MEEIKEKIQKLKMDVYELEEYHRQMIITEVDYLAKLSILKEKVHALEYEVMIYQENKQAYDVIEEAKRLFCKDDTKVFFRSDDDEFNFKLHKAIEDILV